MVELSFIWIIGSMVSIVEVTELTEGGDVRGCLLAAIMILD